MAALQVPGFDVVELLGYGSGGEVWLARERSTGEPVALKRLPVGADLAARDRLRREAAVLAGVDHPHVVRLRSVVGAGDDLVLVLDLAPGGSLARLLAGRGRLEPGEVVTVAVGLAGALAAVHASGLVHGDVTPANVLFSADGRPMLGDLGFGRLLGLPPAEAGGTHGFLDPAVAAGNPPGPASDVHGLAATCLAALTGSPPYDEQGTRLPVPPGTAPALVAVLEHGLQADPAERPTADALAAAAFEAAGAQPVRLAGAAPGPVVVPLTYRVAPGPRPVVDEQAELPVRAPRATKGRRRHRRAGPAPGGGLAREGPRGAVGRLRGRVRGRGRAVLGLAAAAVAVVLAAVTGVAWASSGPAPQTAPAPHRVPTAAARPAAARPAPATPSVAAPPPGPGPVAGRGWVATLAALDRRRALAYAWGDPERLAAVYAARAPALRRDRAVLERLGSAGLRATGMRLSVGSVRVMARGPGQVRLAVVDVLAPYDLVDAAGAVVDHRPGRGPRSWTLVLTRANAGAFGRTGPGERAGQGGRPRSGEWRVYDVVRG